MFATTFLPRGAAGQHWVANLAPAGEDALGRARFALEGCPEDLHLVRAGSRDLLECRSGASAARRKWTYHSDLRGGCPSLKDPLVLPDVEAESPSFWKAVADLRGGSWSDDSWAMQRPVAPVLWEASDGSGRAQIRHLDPWIHHGDASAPRAGPGLPAGRSQRVALFRRLRPGAPGPLPRRPARGLPGAAVRGRRLPLGRRGGPSRVPAALRSRRAPALARAHVHEHLQVRGAGPVALRHRPGDQLPGRQARRVPAAPAAPRARQRRGGGSLRRVRGSAAGEVRAGGRRRMPRLRLRRPGAPRRGRGRRRRCGRRPRGRRGP
ncbi:unnamed protein product, partial [Prorocentrum cordatum]